jgi:hypothetical protein
MVDPPEYFVSKPWDHSFVSLANDAAFTQYLPSKFPASNFGDSSRQGHGEICYTEVGPNNHGSDLLKTSHGLQEQ